MIAVAEGTCMVRLLQIMLRFYHHESCGQCTPCRDGTGWMHRIIDRIVAGDGRPEDIERLYYIAKYNDGTTICGLGDAAGLRRERNARQVPRRIRLLHCPEALALRGPHRMTEIQINGQTVEARADQTVLEAALAAGFYVPYFCWHPRLSIAGNCRMCLVEVEGRGLDIACNMPVSAGMRVLTDSEEVKAHRKAMLQFITLNHPVDCGICDKAGECRLQDYHYTYNGERSKSIEPKVRSTSTIDLSERIVLDNERCILCLRCTRFTHEMSKSKALGVERRGRRLEHPRRRGPLARCSIHIQTTSSISAPSARCNRGNSSTRRAFGIWSRLRRSAPGAQRGCTVQIWHRKAEWRLQALDARQNTCIARVTPLENPAVNGPWICNKGRDLARIFERPVPNRRCSRAGPCALACGGQAARALIAAARRPAALISNWGSNEELAAFKRHLGARVRDVRENRCGDRTG